MANTKTSSRSLVMQEALRDELLKIAAVDKDDRFKKFLKSTALIGAGTGLGYGAGMALEKAVQKAFGAKWATVPGAQQAKLLGAAAGLTAAGAYVGREWLGHERREALK